MKYLLICLSFVILEAGSLDSTSTLIEKEKNVKTLLTDLDAKKMKIILLEKRQILNTYKVVFEATVTNKKIEKKGF